MKTEMAGFDEFYWPMNRANGCMVLGSVTILFGSVAVVARVLSSEILMFRPRRIIPRRV